jgi:dihydroneopterin aldolase
VLVLENQQIKLLSLIKTFVEPKELKTKELVAEDIIQKVLSHYEKNS